MNPFDALAPAWNFLLVHPLLSLLVGAYDVLFKDFGLAIVAVTLAIRLALYPLFVTQIRSQRAMQEVAPALNELKAKYGKDRQRMAEEQMKLYRERGVNPAMGCLPLLLQMPILFAMYAAFLQAPTLTGDQLRGILWPFIESPVSGSQTLDLTAHWLPWIQSCAGPSGTTLNGLGCADPFAVLPILAGATQLIASLMAQPVAAAKTTDPQAKMMQSMVYYFPIITVVIAWQLPAGLAVYWVTTTLFQIVQQYFVTGWGQLVRWLPFLRRIPSPAERELARDQREAIKEVEADMSAEAPSRAGERPNGAEERRSRRRRRRGR
ncbi:MAG: membrane protein insertase YidC [Chloroflexi bacterium]|nr:membrane protein insertase YidC [Chloroflexota bacterium]